MLAPTLLTSKVAHAESSGVDTNVVSAATQHGTTTIANSAQGILHSTDWSNLSKAHAAIVTSIKAGKYATDEQVKAAAKKCTASELLAKNYDWNPIVKLVQVYYPKFTLKDLDAYLKKYGIDEEAFTKALDTLASEGISPTITRMSGLFEQLAEKILQKSASGTVTVPVVDGMLDFSSLGMDPDLYFACPAYNMSVLLAGTAFLTLGVMTFGAEPILAGTTWAVFTFLGGTASGLGAIGSAIFCGF
jgi:hypothetical protein